MQSYKYRNIKRKVFPNANASGFLPVIESSDSLDFYNMHQVNLGESVDMDYYKNPFINSNSNILEPLGGGGRQQQ